MNVCFAVQEMNVPMSQYIEWPITLFIVQLRLVRWAVGTWSPNCFTSLCYSRMRYGPHTSSEPSSLCSDGYNNNNRFPFIANANSITQRHIRYLSICYQQIRGFPTNIHMNESTRCLLTKLFWHVRKWWLPESERQSAYSTLTNWFHVRYEDKKIIYICYVLYMVCIVFVKMNQTMFYRKTFLYEDVWKKREDPKEKEIRFYIKVFAYSTALSG